MSYPNWQYDRKPKSYQHVIIAERGERSTRMAWWDPPYGLYRVGAGWGINPCNVTAWCAMPRPPKARKEAAR